MTLLKFLFKSIAVIVVLAGLLLIFGSLALGLTAAWRLNLIQAYLPKEQVRVIEPVYVQLSGPKFAVQGDRVYFHATVTGSNPSKVSWSIHPHKAGILTALADDSRNAEFSSLEEGKYIITVAVSGEGGTPPHTDHLEFENVSLTSEKEIEDALVAAQPQPQPVHATAAPETAAPPPSVSELTLGAIAMVPSTTKGAEARMIADVIYSLAKQIKGGLLPMYVDIPLEIENRSRKGLGVKAGDWGQFMVSLDTILDEMRRQGKITATAASQADVLIEIANTLQGVR